ncbi:MAG: zinc ABC transporter substrate-binding protein [Desulfobacteraceae bacterium]|nr:zinc ABC transporter substrate-binding protein [Desulfobacteraceae bacterium]
MGQKGKWLPFRIPVMLCAFFLLASGSALAAPVSVMVSILPQKYFVEKIGGNLVEVEVMVSPGATPEHYEPKPKQMSALSRSSLYFACSVPFESVWLPRIASANPKMQIVHTEKLIEKRGMEAHAHHGEKAHGHEDHGDDDEVKDPHIWLAPALVMLQARTIFEALAGIDPRNRATYESNYKVFVSELVELDMHLARIFANKRPGGTFVVFHPAWGYFADAYGLAQVPVQVEGKEPKAKELDQLIKRARELGTKTIFAQPQYSPKSAQTIADAIEGKVVFADDLSPDWEKNLRDVAEQIAAALPGQ